MPEGPPADLTAFVFDGPSAGPPEQAGATVTRLERRDGGLWVLVEPAADPETRGRWTGSPRVALEARLIEEVAAARARRARVTHVMPIAYAPPEADLDLLDRWYVEEHTEMLLRCPAWLRVRRYAIASITGAGWTRLVVHDLAADDVLDSDEVRAAMATPWRQDLAGRPWFTAEPREALRVVPETPRTVA